MKSLGLLYFLMVILTCGWVSGSSMGPQCTDIVNHGTGEDKLYRFYFDPQIRACTPFFYKGQGGNNNRYDSDQECMKACSSNYDEVYPTDDGVCSLPLDYGSCFAIIPKYYYDSTEKNCRMFLYSGCQGNGNRFDSSEECKKICLAKSGRLLGADDAPNPDQKTVNAGLIVGVLGGLVFAGAVISAIVMFVLRKKSKKADRKQVPTSDIELN
ncbi:kunitz-type U19-barytoxin-Tl1a-like [Xyrauchen texanus]|uniref:kunitz-type U19-barytoxin-Tl1a-like n=1 Tax=Xyrauchen texanus TaxID=154827 RepID=UPI002241A124|nr:kunitz-type U19-barytoxin-Tl1a-like [Xyrauchen texanus]